MIIMLSGMMAANVTQETSFDVAEIMLWVLGISNLNLIFYISLSDRYKVSPNKPKMAYSRDAFIKDF